jgi:hypothetical protein
VTIKSQVPLDHDGSAALLHASDRYFALEISSSFLADVLPDRAYRDPRFVAKSALSPVQTTRDTPHADLQGQLGRASAFARGTRRVIRASHRSSRGD